MTATPYDDAFYRGHEDRSSRSARHIVPIALSLIPARSVIDIGCGVGTWASAFLECGVPDVLGIDGDYVNRQMLKIPADRFQPYDLRQPVRMDRTFDLAACLEVAEHLPATRAESLVEDLTRLAPVVLFSAAVPGQGGTDHVNEQYLSYWVEIFARRGYVLIDAMRPRIWGAKTCDWIYRQNMVIFAKPTNPLAGQYSVPTGIDYVHPHLNNLSIDRLTRPRLGYLLRSLPGSVNRSVRSRVRRMLHGETDDSE